MLLIVIFSIWILFSSCAETFEMSKVFLSTKCNCTGVAIKKKGEKKEDFSCTKREKRSPHCIPQQSVHYASWIFSKTPFWTKSQWCEKLLTCQTKTLSHCHWMCFMSNKKKLLCQISAASCFSDSSIQRSFSCLMETGNTSFLPPGVTVSSSA